MKAGIAMRILLIAEFTHAAAVHTALYQVGAALLSAPWSRLIASCSSNTALA